VIPSSAYVRFSPEGPVEVDASLRLTGNSFIHCCTYPDEPPILSVKDRHVSVTVTVPDRHNKVTQEDLDIAWRLAGAVAAYIAELETRMAAQGPAAEGEAA
jgi:hypothetical protein